MTVASYISVSRILLIFPILLLTYYQNEFYNWISLIIFIFAGITDYLDGYIARKTNTESSLGALLDLLADKLLVCLVLLWLVFLSNSLYLIFPTIIIISRELAVSSLRQFIVETVGENPIKVTYIAKSKTTMQFVAISFLILSPHMGIVFNNITILLVFLSALISLYSLKNYLDLYKKYF
tara:strand:+ start:6691 stop:7230 length:540 start_codon:yes stop_codon:yes gene_type:complete